MQDALSRLIAAAKEVAAESGTAPAVEFASAPEGAMARSLVEALKAIAELPEPADDTTSVAVAGAYRAARSIALDAIAEAHSAGFAPATEALTELAGDAEPATTEAAR
jgi:hypothetical protein